MKSRRCIGNLPKQGYITNKQSYITNKQSASLIGVVPIAKESGRYKGKRMIQPRRAQVQNFLYIAIMSAMHCNPIFKATYQRLLDVGKLKKSKLTCV